MQRLFLMSAYFTQKFYNYFHFEGDSLFDCLCFKGVQCYDPCGIQVKLCMTSSWMCHKRMTVEGCTDRSTVIG